MQEMTIAVDGDAWTIVTSTTLKSMSKAFKVVFFWHRLWFKRPAAIFILSEPVKNIIVTSFDWLIFDHHQQHQHHQHHDYHALANSLVWTLMRRRRTCGK